MTVTLILGLLLNAIALPIAGKRVLFLYRLTTSGQPAPDRIENVRGRLGEAVKTQLVEVFGQKKLLKWSVPGAAHFFVFWAFVILATVYLEAYGSLFHEGFAIPLVGHWDALGFLQDFIACMAVISLGVFAVIRVRNAPSKLGRQSRFRGSHLGGAWLVLFLILMVVASMMMFRGAGANTGHFPYGDGAFASQATGNLLSGLSEDTNQVLEHIGLLLHIGIMLGFLIEVLNSKHLHIFVAPLNVLFGRRPDALGAIKPMMAGGQPFNLEMAEDLDEDAAIGIGAIEDFSWKGMLDFSSCTECGRCQSQCPAWNTEKPLSPKLLIMELRDHAMAKAPYLLADSDDARADLPESVLAEVERPLVGETEGDPSMPSGGAVIDPDVLWSCVSCGACVEQCPVDIEHVDHIMDMRRHQVLVESNFPAELNNIFKGMERKGNPWNMDPKSRMDWAKGLDFEVKQVGTDVESLDEVEWLFWVGCAGAYEDRAMKTARAVAELLNMAGVDFAVLGNGETCTGDSARRAGNEFVFQQLAMENAETFKETRARKVVATCAHCFNTLKNEYPEFGVELEVVHHTQLLNKLVREKKLTPVAPTAGNDGGRTITYHDPCFIGRHNKVYEPPRELLEVIPNTTFNEMPRNSERSFCCGAGGARMWMEETLGSRINGARTEEAVATGADQIAVACPFCRVMLSDGLTAQQASGDAREEVEVLDVAQMLLASVKRSEEPSSEDTSAVVAEATDATAAAAGAEALEHTEETDAPAVEEVPEPEDSTPEDTAPEDTAPEDTAPEDTAPESTEPEDASDEADAEPETGETADPDTESVPEVADAEEEPAGGGSEPSTPDTDEPVEQESREEEAETLEPDEKGPEAKASQPEDDESDTTDEESKESASEDVVSVDDVDSTADPVSPDAAPLSDANPAGDDLSSAATSLTSDEDEDEKPTEGS